MKRSLLAATVLAMTAASPIAAQSSGYSMQKVLGYSSRSGGGKKTSHTAKERAKSKAAAKSRRAQRKADKR